MEEPKILLTLQPLQGVAFDSFRKFYYNVYAESDRDQERLPLNLVMINRDPMHYLNVENRSWSLCESYVKKEPAVCLFAQLYGVVGNVHNVNLKDDSLKLEFDI